MSNPISIVDDLIKGVSKLSTVVVSSASVNQSSSSSSAYTSDITDAAWFPATPPGHTQYTWMGIGEVHGTGWGSKPQQKGGGGAKGGGGGAKGGGKAAAGGGGEGKKQQQQQKGEGKAKQPAAPAGGGGGKNKKKAEQETVDNPFAHVDIRVGKITKVWKHPDADSLYVEEIDVGDEEGPRTICSGLVKFISEANMLGASLLVVCNLKPSKLRGIVSNGMVLATSVSDAEGVKQQCELITPPAGSKVGERVSFEGYDVAAQAPAAVIDAKGKNSFWAQLADKGLKTVDGVATYNGKAITTSVGKCTAPTIKLGVIS
jgi:methionine--tRNA ligase beta chain